MIVDCALYEQGERKGGEIPLATAHEEAVRSDDGFVWIGLHEPTYQEFYAVRREFDLHDLAVEDAVKAHQRPKLETYGDSLFIVLKTAWYVDSEEVVEFGEILLFVGDNFVVSVRHGEGTVLHSVRLEVEKRPELLRCGPAAVVHAIVDRVVDEYQPVLEGLDHDIEQVEGQVFSPRRGSSAERIFKLKREVIEFHHATAPLAAPLDKLASGFHDSIHPDLGSYFRDVHDHLLRVVERVEALRDLLNGILTANLTQVGIRQNEDMRRISAWVAIIAVPTMIAGVYGMNFEHMPELEWQYGYPLIVAVMVTACSFLYWRFRRAGWL